MGLSDKSLRIFKGLCANAQQSVRQLAQQTGLSTSSGHRLQQAMDRSNGDPESWFWVTAEGRRWLARLVVAADAKPRGRRPWQRCERPWPGLRSPRGWPPGSWEIGTRGRRTGSTPCRVLRRLSKGATALAHTCPTIVVQQPTTQYTIAVAFSHATEYDAVYMHTISILL
jgi:hypothetical protein